MHSNSYPPLILSPYVCLFVSPSSLYLSSSDPSTPCVPKPVNQQIVNEGLSSKTECERERGSGSAERQDREEFWTNCLFVKTCPHVCLFACLLL